MEQFVVRPATAGGWDYIAAALARLFGRLRATGVHHCVVVEVSADEYVQFIVRPDGGVWAESVGDVFLERLVFTDDQHRELELLGWTEPELFDQDTATTGVNTRCPAMTSRRQRPRCSRA